MFLDVFAYGESAFLGWSMPLFEIVNGSLVAASQTSFDAEGFYERAHIQQLLKANLGLLEDRLLVISEEFGTWIDSSRRIDLLCLDSDANLVVVEVKRTETGGHMELQALRYAAMISAMTFEQLVSAYAFELDKLNPDASAARDAILEFLGWDEVDEAEFNKDTRIILASADFSKEITTTVLWLRDRGIDVKCVRLRPCRLSDGKVLLDVQQLIPLPEAASFQTQIGVKRQAERLQRSTTHELRYEFWERLLNYAKQRTLIHANRKPSGGSWISGGIGRAGFGITYFARQLESQVEIWISHGPGKHEINKAAFHQLFQQREEIERLFEGQLDWQELPESAASRIRFVIPGGYKSPREDWDRIHADMTDAMIRLDRAFRTRVQALQIG